MISATVENEIIVRPPGAAASGVLRVVRWKGRSVVSRAFASSPLRLLTPSNHGSAAWVFTSTYGGGLLGGDSVHLEVDVGDAATALLQTQASTKIYRSPRGASSSIAARVGQGARLLLLPDPTVCFAAASFEQLQEVDVQPGGSLVLMDWLTAGRTASGERWAFERYHSRLTVRYDGRTVLGDALLLSAEQGPLIERLGRFNCLCLIVLVGPDVIEAARSARERIEQLPLTGRAGLLTAAAPLGGREAAGCVIRIAGVSVEQVARAARAYLGFVPGLLGDDPWIRKW